ncbi:hypothetical protein Cni_G20580 [Canna indica]|uniref:Uncharacterized protein n=1 Tax=Canna indica TaxID=4628 RepID=A0AAQ3KTF7_9LILI|nr:hypothetical protein Cni_G20580 [Canna indica]
MSYRGGGGGHMVDPEGQGGAPPHGILLAVVVGLVVAVPFLIGGGGEAITGAISDLLSPTGLLLLPVILILLIRFLSSDRGAVLSDIFAGSPDSIHRVGGSPVGVALLLLLILFLLYYRFSIFGGDDDGDE